MLLVPLLWRGESTTAETPILSSTSGYYANTLTLTMRPGRAGTVIFTRDGSEPTLENGETYAEPLEPAAEADQTAVHIIRARRVDAGGRLLPTVESAAYLVGPAPSLPVVSLIVRPEDLWHPDTGLYTNPEGRGPEWERPAVFTYFPTLNGRGQSPALSTQHPALSPQYTAGLRIHGQFSRAYDKKSFRLYFRSEYGTPAFETPIFPPAPTTAATPPFPRSPAPLPQHKRLVLHAGGQDATQFPSNWTLMRNQVMANLARQTQAYATRSRPVLLYLNGEPWGLYYIRERIGDFWLEDQVGASDVLIVDTPARRVERPEDVGRGHVYWDHLTAYVAAHDLRRPEHYAYVQSQVDLDNFIDYSILQIYSANYDWPFTNMAQFKPETQGGKWHWIIWDNDLSLGLRPWSLVEMTTVEQALDPTYNAGTDIETDGRDTILLRALLRNPEFHGRFVNRWQALMATTLSTESVIAEIDAMARRLEPHIEFETRRWGSSKEEWLANVEGLREFARQRPLVMQLQMQNYLTEPLE